MQDFQDNGFVIVEGSEVFADVLSFYRDIVTYLGIVLEDSGPEFHELSVGLTETLRDGDIGQIDKALQTCLNEVSQRDRSLLGHIYEMGTRPNKFLSAERLFFSSEIAEVTKAYFDSKDVTSSETRHRQRVLVKPARGETLHVFTPGENQYRYNLPIHQDYPYLGQSCDQLTYWLFLSGDQLTGGVRVFPGTHRLGVVASEVGEFGHHEVLTASLPDGLLADYVDFGGKQFCLVAMDSLLLHQSLRNT